MFTCWIKYTSLALLFHIFFFFLSIVFPPPPLYCFNLFVFSNPHSSLFAFILPPLPLPLLPPPSSLLPSALCTLHHSTLYSPPPPSLSLSDIHIIRVYVYVNEIYM